MLIGMWKKHFVTTPNWCGCTWSNKVVTFKKIPTLYPVDIEADKICQTKKKKDMLASENRKQLLTDAFEHWCSWKFRKFDREISVLESLFNKVAGLQLYYKRLEDRVFLLNLWFF